jgi:hypothetical protein
MRSITALLNRLVVMATLPSNILVLTSQQLGDAQARLRSLAMAATDLETVTP